MKIFEHMWLEGYVLLGVFRSIFRGDMFVLGKAISKVT